MYLALRILLVRLYSLVCVSLRNVSNNHSLKELDHTGLEIVEVVVKVKWIDLGIKVAKESIHSDGEFDCDFLITTSNLRI